MKWMRLVVGLIALVSAQSGRTFAGENSVVETEAGSVQGMRVGNVTAFKGIPFAAPPIGDLRWRAPRQADHWNGVKAATSFAPACMQKGVSMPGEVPPSISEDCLYLNIWTPAIGSKKPKAVLVWIYGGGFTNGSASMPLYWGDQLAKRGIVVVTISYRVGLFGFLARPGLTLESEHHVSGNYGLLDQIAALTWVQRNIKSFGGDPKRVTIGGQSAGAMAVSILMASPLAHGLFARAIAESGGFLEPVYIVPGYTMASAETQGEKYARALGATDVQSLRDLPAEKLLENDRLAVKHPIIDSFVLPMAPYEIFKAAKQENIPVLLGSNEDEARAFNVPKDIAPLEFDAEVARHLGFPVSFIQMFTSAYPHDTAANARQSALDLETDLRFRWDMWTWANHQAHLNDHVYYYLFRHHPPFPEKSPYFGWGPSHFAELWYIFDHLNQSPWSWTAADKRLAKAAASYWVNFVKSADPNGPGLASWPQYRGDDRGVLYLDEPVATGPVANASRLAALTAAYADAASKSSQKK